VRLKPDGTRAETRFHLSAKRTSPFKSVGASVQSTTDSRGVRISGGDCIIFSKYVDHSLKMSLQGGKKPVKSSDEREIIYNVNKFMKTESEVGINSFVKSAEESC
jgi:hypothetical protein